MITVSTFRSTLCIEALAEAVKANALWADVEPGIALWAYVSRELSNDHAMRSQ